MSIGLETEATRATYRRNMRYIWGYCAVSWVLAFLWAFVINQPWTATMGVAGTPERNMFATIYRCLAGFPCWAWGTYYYINKHKWLAEDMGIPYEEGKMYPAFTPKRLVSIAMGIAFFGVSGIIPAGTFDFAQFAATFMTVLYGPLEGGFGVALGGMFIRGPIFSGNLNPLTLSSFINDGGIYFICGCLYRQYIYYHTPRWRATFGLLLFFAVEDRMHGGWFIPGVLLGLPINNIWPAYLTARTTTNFYSRPFAWLPNLVLGYLVADALQKYKV